ncbi:hypothetical protein Ancab_017812 [Ancistrocladus abbreviatus]
MVHSMQRFSCRCYVQSFMNSDSSRAGLYVSARGNVCWQVLYELSCPPTKFEALIAQPSLLGAASVIVGLYIVLWGEAREIGEQVDLNHEYKQTRIVQEVIDDSEERRSHGIDLKQPLLAEKATNLTG